MVHFAGRRTPDAGRRTPDAGRRTPDAGRRTVLFAVRNATALHRLLDAAPALADDRSLVPVFTLVPGSPYSAEAFTALEGRGAHYVAWEEALTTSFDLILAASPNGELARLKGPLVLLPHGAGFSKRTPYAPDGDGSAANGLDPAALLRPDGTALARLHALPHPRDLRRLAEMSPRAAAPAAVVGDPTLDRLLESRPRRERFRAAFGTRGRRMVAVLSTFGAESLLERRPELPLRLAAELPYDGWQVVLVAHPNEHADGAFALRQRLARARRAHVLLTDAYEEWGAALVAADCVITDHGSAALYAAALDRPVLGAYDGGAELLDGTPMASLLGAVPHLDEARPYGPQLEAAVRGPGPGALRAHARGVFAQQGSALERLRERLYGLLDEPPPRSPAVPDPLPVPCPDASGAVGAFSVHTRVSGTGDEVRMVRHPLVAGGEGGWTAAEADWAGARFVQSARLLYRHAGPHQEPGQDPGHAPGSAAEWSARTLEAYPVCDTAAELAGDGRFAVRVRGGEPMWLRALPCGDGAAPDLVGVVCAVRGRLNARPDAAWPAGGVRCLVGGRAVTVVRITPPA